MKKPTIELLSPAGSFEALQAAINGGADAVYFGVEQLNMRAKSINSFMLEDIQQIAAICKANEVRTYLTLNTIMYDHDMQLLHAILKEVKKYAIDAVIASDFAVIEACNQLNIPLHISTQANISNLETVQFFARFSDVVVLARELTLKQVAHICNEIERRNIKGISGELMKVEVFVHGALCMAISGKCYLSLHAQNASANRGACTQNCRRPYTVTDTETNEKLLVDNEYIMSPKDLCMIDKLSEVVNSGVSVLKIEGRGKGPDYVYTVTQCYREALQALENSSYTAGKIEDWMKRLATVYNRGFWNGYYLGHQLGEWTAHPGSSATEKKIYVGKGSKYYPKIKVGEFAIESGSVKEGDTLMITGAAVGMAREKMVTLTVNGAQKAIAVKGDKITFPFGTKITQGDKLYKIVETANG
ncbi:MAG: yhbU [Ferruginibacter sp.]|nr:yhbU [Ferruginibacter sp.]